MAWPWFCPESVSVCACLASGSCPFNPGRTFAVLFLRPVSGASSTSWDPLKSTVLIPKAPWPGFRIGKPCSDNTRESLAQPQIGCTPLSTLLSPSLHHSPSVKWARCSSRPPRGVAWKTCAGTAVCRLRSWREQRAGWMGCKVLRESWFSSLRWRCLLLGGDKGKGEGSFHSTILLPKPMSRGLNWVAKNRDQFFPQQQLQTPPPLCRTTIPQMPCAAAHCPCNLGYRGRGR